MSKERGNTTNGTAKTITTEDIRAAIEALKKAGKEPVITHISSKYEWWKLIKKDSTSRQFSLYGGIPLYTDPDVPSNIARIHFSDGATRDIEISSKPNFLPLTAK